VTAVQTHVRFDAPVGATSERDAPMLKNGKPCWPGAWFDATPFGTRYDSTGKWAVHPGADLNLPAQGDLNAPCFSPAEGVVVFASPLAVWGVVVVIRHTLADGKPVYSRFAHLNAYFVVKGQGVSRGEAIGLIGNAAGRYAPHLHFDLARGERLDLGEKPGDWPGDDKARVQRDYYDPLEFIYQQHHD
jgi:murein DD-endopeptidase MepM/ murein hydrolase activator NlpD